MFTALSVKMRNQERNQEHALRPLKRGKLGWT